MKWSVSKTQPKELTHYGVLGMKWGVRKDERKSGKNKSSSESDDDSRGKNWIDTLKDTFNINRDTGSIKDQAIKTNIGVVEIDGFDAHEKRSASTFIDFLADSVPERYAPIEEAQRKLDEFEQNKYTMAYTRGHDQTYLVNHDGPNDIRLINCFECSLAYEMRHRGYNVQAKEMNGGWNAETMHAFDVKDGFRIQVNPNKPYANNKTAAAKEAYNQIAEQCISFGDGARGCLGVQWANYDSGHSMYWVVENGEFKIIDAQDSTRDGYEVFMSPAEAIDTDIVVYRLDNADILPGVTDFVEPYSAVTDEEKEVASKKKNAKTLDKIKAQNKAKAARQPVFERAEQIRDQVKKTKDAQRNHVEKLLRNVSKATTNAVNTLVFKGKQFLSNPLGIQEKETVTRTSTIKKSR